MKSFQAFINGIQQTVANLKLWALLYVINLLFAGLVIVPLGYYVGHKLAYTKATERLWSGFDFTLFNDFINQYKSFPQLFSIQTFIVGLLFLVLYVFLSGGLLNKFKEKENNDLVLFWSGCGVYFWRLLRLTIYFISIQILLVFISLALFSYSIDGGLASFRNESSIYYRALIGLITYGIIGVFVFMVQDYAKVMVVENNRKWILKDIIHAFYFSTKHLFTTFGLYLLNIIFLLTFTALYLFLKKILKTEESITPISFLLGQFFVFLQIGFKLLNLSSATALYKSIK